MENPANAKMSSPATLGDESSPWQGSASEEDLVHEEAMLKRKLAILEEFMDNENAAPSLEDRCQILRQKIGSLEGDIFRLGRTDASRRYLKETSSPVFFNARPEEFMDWLSNTERATSAQFNRAEMDLVSSLNKRAQFFGSGDAFNIFPATSEVSSHEDDGQMTPRPHKRPRIAEKDKPPCLRCRILKKKCDSLDQCSHCPLQSFDSENDYWKILGCFRGCLQEFSQIFCPAFARSTTRTLRYRSGGTETVNFVLTKSRVSDQKRRRMMHLVETRPDFAQLDNAAWDDITNRGSVSRAAITLIEYGGDGDDFTPDGFLQQDYEAAWSVLQAVSMDSTYLTKTEYNLFTLLRQGNEFSVYEPGYWELFNQTKRILRQSVEFYLLERLCSQMASGDMVPPFDPSSSTPNTLVLVDLKDDMESFLRRFDKICAGRAKLTGFAQLACFYALLVFGIAKSILIDSYSIRAEYEEPNPWNEEDATRITSAYKALVSVFCWSSKSDVIRDSEVDEDDELGAALLETRAMVHSDKWEERSFRGMKEFFLSLGSCFFAGGSYNGFFMQRFGRERVPKTFSKGVVMASGVTERFSSHSKTRESGRDHQGTLLNQALGEPSNGPSVHVFSVAHEQASFDRFEASTQHEIPSVSFISQSPIKSRFQDFTPEPKGDHRPSISRNQSTFTFVAHDESEGHCSRRGQSRRKGALDAQTLRKAREVRKLGACWNCWVMKIPCSEGAICDRCKKKASIPVYQLCNRNSFAAYTDLFFPDYLIAEFSTTALQRYTDANTRGFTSQILNVVVTWGEGTLKIGASPFVTAPNGIMQKTYHGQDGHPLGVESLPVGLTEANMVLLEQTCLEELEHKIATQEFVIGICCYRTSDISRSVLEIVFRYYLAMPIKHPLIHTILQLRLAIRAISNPPIFTDSSAKTILCHMQTKHPAVEFYSSRLLNRQLKHVTFRLCRQLATKALSKLEKAVRSRDKSFWPVYFACMILLCSTIEHDQILLNAHIQTARVSQPETLAGLEDEPHKACQDLEDGPYSQLTHLFHALYRTGKRDSGGLNPFRDEFELTNEKHFDDAAMTMIHEIKKTVFEKVGLLNERNKPLIHAMKPEDFARRNSGRMVAKFLLSFLPLNEK